MDREPVAIMAVVQAVLALVVAFGLDLTGEQTAAILAVTAAIMGVWVRAKVTPWTPPNPGDPNAFGE